MGRVRGKSWMQEHVSDAYVKRARAEGMRSRAARIAVRGVRKADIATTRAVLLAIIENLARDEQDKRMPSTRARFTYVSETCSCIQLLPRTRPMRYSVLSV